MTIVMCTEKKTDVFLLLRPKEQALFKSRAEQAEMSRSEFLEGLLLGTAPAPAPQMDWEKTAGKLKEAGRRLDAIAHEGNRTAWIDGNAYAAVVEEITGLLRGIEIAAGTVSEGGKGE